MREYRWENSFRSPSLPGCVRLSRNVDHVNNIPALCPLCSRLRCYRGCISSLQLRCYVEGGFSAAVISLPLNNTQRGAARRRTARACGIIQCRVPWSVKRLICCAMAVTHLTIGVTKNRRSEQCRCRWTTEGRIDARKYDTPDIPWTLRCTFSSRLDVTVARSISSSSFWSLCFNKIFQMRNGENMKAKLTLQFWSILCEFILLYAIFRYKP